MITTQKIKKTKKTRQSGKILSVLFIFAILCSSTFLFTACDDGTQEIKDNISEKYNELKTIANETTDLVNSTPGYGIQLDESIRATA